MSNNKLEFRWFLRASLASLSFAALSPAAPFASAQQVVLHQPVAQNNVVQNHVAPQPTTNYSDAIVLPKYYPGAGRVLVLGGIESARPAQVQTTSAPMTLVTSTQETGGNTYTVQATVSATNPNQIEVVVQPAQSGTAEPATIPNQQSNLNRADVAPNSVNSPAVNQPPREQPQFRNVQPRVVERVREQRPEGDRPNNDRRGPEANDRGPQDRGPQDRGPQDRGPQGPMQRGGFDVRGMQGPGMQGPGMQGPGPGMMPGIPGPGPRGNVRGMEEELSAMERVFESPVVREFLELKEEISELKAMLKIQEREYASKLEISQMRFEREQMEVRMKNFAEEMKEKQVPKRGGGNRPEMPAKEDAANAQRIEALKMELAEANNRIQQLSEDRERSVAQIGEQLNALSAHKTKLEQLSIQNAMLEKSYAEAKNALKSVLAKQAEEKEKSADLQAKKDEQKKQEAKKEEAKKEKEKARQRKKNDDKDDEDEMEDEDDKDDNDDKDESSEDESKIRAEREE